MLESQSLPKHCYSRRMTSAPLPRLALYEEVAEVLRQRIFHHELEPGAWIDELKIAEEIGISRTPMREALKVLAAEGLVTMKVRRGAYVTEISEQDLREVYHMLGLLESDAVAVVARTATPEQLGLLQALHEELEASAHDREAFFAVNERFHLQLLALADNRWRNQMVADLRKVMKLNRHNSLLKQGRIEDSLQEHRAIMQALQTHQPEVAMQAMQAHFANSLDAAG
jgi:DNA-binding GntR family transcriptional regulator